MVTYTTNNKVEQSLLRMYCDGKGRLWNKFFGFQKMEVKDVSTRLFHVELEFYITYKIPFHVLETVKHLSISD